MCAVIVAVHIPMYCIDVIIAVLLTFDVHALQGYSIVGCVFVSGSIFHTVWIGQEDLWIASALQKIQFKHVFSVKQPLHKATEFSWKLLVQLSVHLLAFASA